MDTDRLARVMRHVWPADAPLVDGLELAASEFSRRCETESPDALLPALRDYMTVLQELLSRAQSPPLEARLQAVASQAEELLGFSSFVGGHRADAFTYFAVAEVLAREAERGDLIAMALAAKSRMYSRTAQEFGDPERAVALLDAAELVAGPGAPPALRAWVHGRRAEERAELGDDPESGRDLERAYRIVNAIAPADHNLFSSLDSAWIEQYRGARAVKLGHTAEAIEVYDSILQRTDPRLMWERGVALTQLATAWALEGEVERACALLNEAVELAAAAGNASGAKMVLRARERQLGRWRNDPHVRRLDEALRAARRQG